MQTRSKERTGAGGLLIGAPKAEIRNAAATTSRCVGSDKVASRSCDRPAIIGHDCLCCSARSVFLTRISYSIPHTELSHGDVKQSAGNMAMPDCTADRLRKLIAGYLGVDASRVPDEAHLSAISELSGSIKSSSSS
jgi:hypothetical protein